ncbi:MAG: hypothetical protein QHH07_12465, partial [Sedimentisphaerales bacterium]|nr:hypothetical protein [Sedimentisphaerales bacterium]
ISVRGGLATPLAADTLFGHICWAVRYHQGQKALEEMLGSYSATYSPVILSDPFPLGFLPRPILQRPGPEDEDRLLQRIMATSRAELTDKLPGSPIARQGPALGLTESFQVLKWLYKLKWLDMDGFNNWHHDNRVFPGPWLRSTDQAGSALGNAYEY